MIGQGGQLASHRTIRQGVRANNQFHTRLRFPCTPERGANVTTLAPWTVQANHTSIVRQTPCTLMYKASEVMLMRVKS
eukprot:1159347-Pelagomonas_calceolata.AAC.5